MPSNKLALFETQCGIRYYSDDERREKQLPPEHMRIGEGVCPFCGQTITVVSDNGTRGRYEYCRGHNYFANHYIKRTSEKEVPTLCHGSEEVFDLLADQVVGTPKAVA